MLKQRVIKDLFKLPAEENLFDDFSCTYKMKPGKLYVLENHLCFYADFLGETKLCLSFAEIESIVQNGSKIEVKEKGTIHSFSKFDDIELTFQYMRTSWANVNPKADLSITEDEVPEPPRAHSENLVEESKSADIQPKSSEAGALSMSIHSMEQKIEDKPPAVAPICFPVDDPEMMEKSYVKYPKSENEFVRFVFPFSSEEYYSRFVSPEAPLNDLRLYTLMNSKNFDDQGWIADPDDPTKSTRKLIFEYKLQGNIFVPFAYTIKEITMTRTSDSLTLLNHTSTPKVPFGTSFNVDDTWQVLPLDEPSAVVLIISVKINWIKSTWFKEKITKSSNESFKLLTDTWIQEVKKRNLHTPPGYVPPGKEVRRTELQHQIEKSYRTVLKAPVETGSIDVIWTDFKWVLNNYWFIFLILFLSYLLFFAHKYILGIYDRLNSIEEQLLFLSQSNHSTNR